MKLLLDHEAIIHYVGYFEYRNELFDSTYCVGKLRSLRLGQRCIGFRNWYTFYEKARNSNIFDTS